MFALIECQTSLNVLGYNQNLFKSSSQNFETFRKKDRKRTYHLRTALYSKNCLNFVIS